MLYIRFLNIALKTWHPQYIHCCQIFVLFRSLENAFKKFPRKIKAQFIFQIFRYYESLSTEMKYLKHILTLYSLDVIQLKT